MHSSVGESSVVIIVMRAKLSYNISFAWIKILGSGGGVTYTKNGFLVPTMVCGSRHQHMPRAQRHRLDIILQGPRATARDSECVSS
eukprot:COSAG01_NODE_3910_length_5551_cov_3.620139_2_plen_86_part_00